MLKLLLFFRITPGLGGRWFAYRVRFYGGFTKNIGGPISPRPSPDMTTSVVPWGNILRPMGKNPALDVFDGRLDVSSSMARYDDIGGPMGEHPSSHVGTSTPGCF